MERDVFFDKDAIVDIGEVAFEGETKDHLAETEFSNSIPEKTTTSTTENALETTNTKALTEKPANPILSSQLPSRLRQNSLEGLPQFDPDQYGCGKLRGTTRVKEMTLLTCEDASHEPKTSDAALDHAEANCICEAIHMAMPAIAKDKPPIEIVINGDESASWKSTINEELTQIEKLDTWEFVEAPNGANVIPCHWVLH
jgi:hypothetical protein